MTERSMCGSGGCVTCPFSYSEEAEQVQNYGCLPDRFDIIKMKEESNQNWACHGDENVLCGGFAKYIKENRPDLNIKEGGLISYETWTEKGKDVAVYKAEMKLKQKKDKFNNTTYILFRGEYHRRRVIMTSIDVKLIAKMYVENLEDSVDVEVWKNNEYVGGFDDYEKVESKVKKALSKYSVGLV